MNSDELAKSMVCSGLIEALQIDYETGDIINNGFADVSSELYYAMSIWDFYDKESAIERAVIARMKGLADEPANNLNLPDFSNGNTVLKDLAKQVTGKTLKNIDNEFFGGLYGDKIAFTMSHGENIANLLDGNISGRQFMKNTVLGFMTTAVTISAMSILPISGGILGFLQVYGIKSKAKEKLKGILDSFIEDDDKRMVKIFNQILTEEFQGKFLTKYEIEFLNEAIVGNFTKDFIREMLDKNNDTAREAFVRKCIHESFGRAFRHRIFVKMPTEKDWQDGLARVKRRIETSTNLFADMNSKRADNIALWKEQHKKEEKAEQLFMDFKIFQALPLLKELADEDNVRARYMLIVIRKLLKTYPIINIELDDDYVKDLLSKNISAGDVCSIFHSELKLVSKESKKSNLNKLIYLAENVYDAFAQFELAGYYFSSREPRNKYESLTFKYLHMAAEHDYSLAFYTLAKICFKKGYSRQILFEPDDEKMEWMKKSIEWLRKATEKGMRSLAVDKLHTVYFNIWNHQLKYCDCITKHHKWFKRNLTEDKRKFPELDD